MNGHQQDARSFVEEQARLAEDKGAKIKLAREIIVSFSSGNSEKGSKWPRGPFAYSKYASENRGEEK